MLNGYRKEKDIESRERFLIMRKLMWASLAVAPGMKRGFKETDVMKFPWEQKLLKTISIDENEKLLEEIAKVKAFYERLDGKKNEA